jgi:hypothetical protein
LTSAFCGGIDHAGSDEIFVLAGSGVVAVVTLAVADPLDDYRAFDAPRSRRFPIVSVMR